MGKLKLVKSRGASEEEMLKVADYQKKLGVKVDGAWGKETQAAYSRYLSDNKLNNVGKTLKEISITAPKKQPNNTTSNNTTKVPDIIKTNLKTLTKPSNNPTREEKREGYLDRVFKDNVLVNGKTDPRATKAARKLMFQDPSKGVGDYLSTLFTVPQKEINHLLTRKYESPATTWNRDRKEGDKLTGGGKFIADVATDPMMFETPGALIEKGAIMTGKAAAKYAPIAGKAIVKGGKLVAQKSLQAGKYALNKIKQFPLDKIAEAAWRFKTKLVQAGVHYNEDDEQIEKKKLGVNKLKIKK